MQKFGRRIDCELQPYGKVGCVCWIGDEDGWCLYRRRWADCGRALADAEEQQQALARDGWIRDT